MMTGSRKLGKNILMALIMMLFPYTYTNAAGIGTWRNYLSYHDVTQIEDFTRTIPTTTAFRPLTRQTYCPTAKYYS